MMHIELLEEYREIFKPIDIEAILQIEQIFEVINQEGHIQAVIDRFNVDSTIDVIVDDIVDIYETTAIKVISQLGVELNNTVDIPLYLIQDILNVLNEITYIENQDLIEPYLDTDDGLKFILDMLNEFTTTSQAEWVTYVQDFDIGRLQQLRVTFDQETEEDAEDISDKRNAVVAAIEAFSDPSPELAISYLKSRPHGQSFSYTLDAALDYKLSSIMSLIENNNIDTAALNVLVLAIGSSTSMEKTIEKMTECMVHHDIPIMKQGRVNNAIKQYFIGYENE